MAQGPFSGIAGALTGVFGGSVQVSFIAGDTREIEAIFRNSPTRVDTPGGVQILTSEPTLRAHLSDAILLTEGDLIDPDDGFSYRFLSYEKPESPADDPLVWCIIEVAE
ncbi:hypothetical protein [Falsihalocynthiibacter sp. CO-5D18]|uniref:head-tail joining protein n=1 Tax=Falsihalocynthiibacter sp. CO-5D18 TaxID=3240872 RepID=UPI00350F362D